MNPVAMCLLYPPGKDVQLHIRQMAEAAILGPAFRWIGILPIPTSAPCEGGALLKRRTLIWHRPPVSRLPGT